MCFVPFLPTGRLAMTLMINRSLYCGYAEYRLKPRDAGLVDYADAFLPVFPIENEFKPEKPLVNLYFQKEVNHIRVCFS